uniref:SWIM-type domain-containing protein n=1 Tax=Globodera pallida TaxID=36090 RepID=A0A183BX73_GLOPA
MNELKRNSDKWQFLKHVDGMDELDRVRRQHQVQLQKEDEEGIIYRCRGSAHCPYRMAFYHDENAIYILHSHSHDAVVPIVRRISEENLSGKRISAGSTGGRSNNKSSKDCVDLDETDDAEDEDEIEAGGGGKAKAGRGKDDGLEQDHEDGGRRRVLDKTSKKYWLQLGKVMGDIDEVCQTLCQQHFVRKIGMTSTKKNKIWFKCPQWKCQYSMHQLKQLCSRSVNVYFRCARFGNACPYRAIWQRQRGLVYHRYRHYHRKLLGGHKHSPEASRPRRHSSANVLDSDKMPADNSSAEQTAASSVDKLSKKWRFLAKLDGISMRRSADSGSSSSTATLEQQLEQLCAERHLSRSRLSSSSSRIWLHCAQHRQLEVACPYRVVVHVPEGTVFHRMRHNHPVPYNLSDTENGDDQQKKSTNETPRPNTRSSLKNGGQSEAIVANVRTKRQAKQSAPTSGVKTRSTAAVVAVTSEGGGVSAAADQSPSDADVTLTMSSSSSSSLSSADEDEAAASGGVISFQSSCCTDNDDDGSDHSRRRPNTRLFAKKLCKTWPKSGVRAKRNAFVKARASISCGLQAEEQQPTSIAAPSSPSTPRIYRFSNRNWRFMADKIGDRKALSEFCRANMLRVAGGIITSNYRNRMLCVRNGCPFRALWLNQQGLAYGRSKHNHSLTKIRSVVKEEEMNDGIFKLADFVHEFEALALRQALYFRVDNRLLMLRDEHSAIRLAEFTGCQEEFNEKVEHWIKADYADPKQLMEALNVKCAEYFQQSQAPQQQQQALQS